MTLLNEPQKIRQIDTVTLKQWIDSDRVIVVDVREPGEYAGGCIPTATSLPLSKFDPLQLPTSQNKQVVIYCQSGRRSHQAAQKLLAAGQHQFLELENGINAWNHAGYPVQKAKNAPISLMRQVQIVAGSLVVTGTVLGAFVSPWFLLLSGFVGSGLVFAGITNTCGLAMLLAKLPYNQVKTMPKQR